MIEDAKRSIAFLCPSCRQPVILERSVFQLAAAGGKLPCPCGKSSIRIDLMGDRVNLTVPCLFCEQEHTVTCSTHAFLTEKCLAFSCANSGLDCCYVGEEEPVFAAMKRLEETLDVLEAEAGAEGTFLNDLVMEEILGELRDIGLRDGISCTCGCRDLEAEDQLQLRRAVLRPLRRGLEAPGGDHVRPGRSLLQAHVAHPGRPPQGRRISCFRRTSPLLGHKMD